MRILSDCSHHCVTVSVYAPMKLSSQDMYDFKWFTVYIFIPPKDAITPLWVKAGL